MVREESQEGGVSGFNYNGSADYSGIAKTCGISKAAITKLEKVKPKFIP